MKTIRPLILLLVCFSYQPLYSNLISDLDLDTKGLEKALTNTIPKESKKQALEADKELLGQYQICTDREANVAIKQMVNKIVASTHLKGTNHLGIKAKHGVE